MIESVHRVNDRLRGPVGGQLIGGEVVLQSIDERFGYVVQVGRFPPDAVILQDGDNLVVCGPLIDEADSADHMGAEENLRAIDHPFAEYADIERVSVAPLGAREKGRDPGAAERPRDESVQGGRQGRRPLRAFHA